MLGARDPDFVRRTLPLLWALLRTWFRPEVRGLEHIPETGSALLVGNHSGGNVAPDTLVLAAAFSRRFGADRAFYQLAHDLVVALPWLRLLRRYGTVRATPATARAALAQGAVVLVYPGGDWEAHRPSWEGDKTTRTSTPRTRRSWRACSPRSTGSPRRGACRSSGDYLVSGGGV